LGCAAILLRISTILRCRKVIHSEGTYFTGSVRVHISTCADFRSVRSSACCITLGVTVIAGVG